MIRIALIGYGKMGKTIEKLITENYPDMSVVLRINSQNSDECTALNLRNADVAIEFSSPHTAYHNILQCFEANIPVVCGSTGWYEELNIVKQLCNEKNNTLLYATNFSIGVNLFFELNKKLAHLMQHQKYSLRIDETHHTQKLDKPSGTAVSIAQDIIQNNATYSNWNLNEATHKENIPVFAHREEHVPGTHTVSYTNEIDQIQITHTAFSREGFADGAIQASRWIIGKQGFFQMKDVLSL
ncbi:MAG: 4-hydroxy-tetrahydrodipicolinate reductase [Bacteroidota bacterium]